MSISGLKFHVTRVNESGGRCFRRELNAGGGFTVRTLIVDPGFLGTLKQSVDGAPNFGDGNRLEAEFQEQVEAEGHVGGGIESGIQVGNAAGAGLGHQEEWIALFAPLG
jgi:hypothetical protein